MSSTLFAVLAIGAAGFLGSGIKADSKTRGGVAVVFATGFVLLCAAVGYVTGVNPGKIMTICGLAFATWFVASIFTKSDK